MELLSRDLRYAARMLRRSPGFTIAAILILAVGIGVNIAAFGFFNLIVLRPLPVRDPDTLLRFQRLGPSRYASVLPYPEMAFFREHSKTLSAVMGWNAARLTADDDGAPLKAHFVTANLFGELGAVPELGRLLDPDLDEVPDAAPAVVLGHAFWERHFGADPSVVGRTIHLNGKPATVAGVAAIEFSGLSLDNPDVWLPMIQQPYFVTGSRLLTDFSVEGIGVAVWGRLAPGVNPKAAESELQALAARLHSEHPDDIWEDERLPSKPGGYATGAMSSSHHGTGARDPDKLTPVAGMIGALVLLILTAACGNLGSLLLARGVAREGEIAIRVAVGAGRGRLVRQLFTESLLLGLLGSLAGLGLGYVVLRTLMAMTGAPDWLDPAPDWRVVFFAVAMGFAAAILFGLTPALHGARQRHRATSIRQVLIGVQVAASCVLLIVAGLLVQALNHASSSNPGFEYRQVVSIDPALGAHGYASAEARTYLDTLTSRLRNLPGVESVSLASTLPFGNKTATIGAVMSGRSIPIHVNSIDTEFFRTMTIPLLRGRNLMAGDVHAIVVSQSFAVAAWAREEPLGKTFATGDVKYTVVGVVGDARVTGLQDVDAVECYFPAQPTDRPSMGVLVKTSGPPEGLTPTLTSIAKAVDPRVRPDVQLMKDAFRRKLQDTEYSALSVSLLATVALLLACLGIVGLVTYSVSQRTKEIGIRMALGATSWQVVSIVLRQFSRPVVSGLLAGVGGAAVLSQVLRRAVYGIGNIDPVAYLAAIGIFAVTVALAALLPARRALRVDPLRALRCG
jgi:predicted permease